MWEVRRIYHLMAVVVVLFLVYILMDLSWHTSHISDVKESSKPLHEYLDHDAVFQVRQKHLTNVCIKQGYKPPNSLADSSFTGSTVVEVKHHIFYCPVQKVGSTFWRKTLKALSSQGGFKSPFRGKGKNSSKILLYQHFSAESKKYKYLKKWFMKTAVSILVVRDPYTKIFSAYVDKLFHPNYLFWKLLGQPIEQEVNHNDHSCGSHVSFSDYIKYIVMETNKGTNLNPHFTPIYKHCYPCKTKYDFIMKFEHFKDDAHYVFNKWNARFNLNISTLIDLESKSAIYIASKHINISFSTIKQFSQKCNISHYNFLLRTWRFLQITGVLPKEIDFPFQNNESISLVTKEKYLEVVKDVLASDIDWSAVKRQRHEALVQAYKGVDSAQLQKLHEIVKPDCQYFDYDDNPDYLHEKASSKFDYFDGIK